MNKIIGKVIEGKKRGKKLGYPTANIRLHKKIEHGIYISKTQYKKKIYNSVTFIGNAVTFGEKKIFAECFILDFNKNIYNDWITITLIKKIRINQKFSSAQTLVKQIEKDILVAREYFKENV